MTKMTIDEFNVLLAEEMPFALEAGLCLDEIENGEATMTLPYDDTMLRPGGTISGPSMMMLADATMYAVVLSMIGRVALAVTTNFNINFLRKPAPGDISAEGKIIKLGKRLAVIQVTLYSVNEEDPVAHATGTYSIPPVENRS
jgi:uncharacterized protein (TIGR00369 family)